MFFRRTLRSGKSWWLVHGILNYIDLILPEQDHLQGNSFFTITCVWQLSWSCNSKHLAVTLAIILSSFIFTEHCWSWLCWGQLVYFWKFLFLFFISFFFGEECYGNPTMNDPCIAQINAIVVILSSRYWFVDITNDSFNPFSVTRPYKRYQNKFRAKGLGSNSLYLG